MAFGKYLRKLRKAKGLTLKQLAKGVSKTHAYLAQIESGKFPPPPDPVIMALAERLGEDPDVLLVMAGRTPAGLIEIIQERPFRYARLLKQLKGAPVEVLDETIDHVSRRKVRDGNW